MADCLSVLRQFHTSKRSIKVESDVVIFNDIQWPCETRTNYLKYGSDKDNSPKEYYTLITLVYFLENASVAHPRYVRDATAKNIPVVRFPDRKDLMAYLNGEIQTSSSIDKSAPLEVSQHRSTKRSQIDDKLTGDAAKRSRLEEGETGTENIRSLSETLSVEKIAAIKAKRAATLRKTNRFTEEDLVPIFVDGLRSSSAVEIDADLTKEIVSKERVWRTRATVLQCANPQLSKNIFAICHAVKTQEESGVTIPPVATTKQPVRPSQPSYNRYFQEKFQSKEETEGFKIDTMGTYAGVNLKSVTEGGAAKKITPNPIQAPVIKSLPSQPTNLPMQHKRTSRTPIIIVPAATTSLITLINCKDFLQDFKFLDSEQKKREGARRENEVLIQRSKQIGSNQSVTVPYRIVDNPMKLTVDNWECVVACFVQGTTWQFKGWPYLLPDGSPTDIFSRIRAFHLKWDDLPVPKNVSKWDVCVLSISRNHRHLDRATVIRFWDVLDLYLSKNKTHLRT